jgi:hypothetical protein
VGNRESNASWRVISGVPESLEFVAGHRAVDGIARFRLVDPAAATGAMLHCAMHVVTGRFVPRSQWRYTQPQVHDFDEVNLLLSETGRLRFRYEVDGVTRVVESPCTVYLPAGATHRMEAVGGTGILICLHLKRGEDHVGS